MHVSAKFFRIFFLNGWIQTVLGSLERSRKVQQSYLKNFTEKAREGIHNRIERREHWPRITESFTLRTPFLAQLVRPNTTSQKFSIKYAEWLSGLVFNIPIYRIFSMRAQKPLKLNHRKLLRSQNPNVVPFRSKRQIRYLNVLEHRLWQYRRHILNDDSRGVTIQTRGNSKKKRSYWSVA